MRTEVKLGIVVGLIVVVSVAVFLVGRGAGSNTNRVDVLPMDGPAANAPETVLPPRDALRGAGADRPTAGTPPRAGGEPRGGATPPASDRERVATGRPTLGEPRPTPGTTPPATTDVPAPPADRTVSGEPVGPPVLITDDPGLADGPVPDDVPAEREPARPAPAEPAGGRTDTPGVTPPARQPEAPRAIPPGSIEPPAGARRHKIVEGDSLWSLAQQYYGDGSLHTLIKGANPDVNEQALRIGSEIVIPPRPATPGSPAAAPTGRTPGAGGGEAARPADANTYVIQENDTLVEIAARLLGDASLWPRIKAANPGLDELRLPIGKVITIPRGEAGVTPTGAPPRPTPAGTGGDNGTRPSVWVVGEGDTLSNIARRVLGDSKHHMRIFELNRDRLDSPDDLPLGIELRLPPRENSGTATRPTPR